MRLAEVLFFYVCVGLGVAARVRSRPRVLALLLWPLFLPSLLSPMEERFETAPRSAPSNHIAAAFHRLQEALRLWEHAPQLPLLTTERALVDLDRRCQALAELLGRPENRLGDAVKDERAAQLQRRQNLTALAGLHEQLAQEIDGALARMDELATRIQLAHFSGRPMGDVDRQLADLIGVVEGIQAVHHELDRDLHPPRV